MGTSAVPPHSAGDAIFFVYLKASGLALAGQVRTLSGHDFAKHQAPHNERAHRLVSLLSDTALGVGVSFTTMSDGTYERPRLCS